MTDADSHDIDAIVAALARLRGRGRGPGPGGPFGHEGSGRGRHGHGHTTQDGGDVSGEDGGPRGFGGPRGPRGASGWDPGSIRMAGPARMRMLEALAAASHPLSVSEVGEAIGVDQPRASRLIQQSVELGLVRREADPGDARRTRVALTEQGATVVRGFRGQRREHLSEALTDFSAEERADLARLLTKLAASWPQR